MQYVANDKFYCPFSTKPMLSDRCFHRIFLKNKREILKYALSLNSTLQSFFVMLFGRANLGLGALKFETKDAKNIFLLNPSCISSSKTSEIMAAIGKRPPESLFIECGINPESKTPIEEQEPKPLPDRKELDDIVFDAIGLTDEERKDVYRAVCRLVWNRISKAKSAKKR